MVYFSWFSWKRVQMYIFSQCTEPLYTFWLDTVCSRPTRVQMHLAKNALFAFFRPTCANVHCETKELFDIFQSQPLFKFYSQEHSSKIIETNAIFDFLRRGVNAKSSANIPYKINARTSPGSCLNA